MAREAVFPHLAVVACFIALSCGGGKSMTDTPGAGGSATGGGSAGGRGGAAGSGGATGTAGATAGNGGATGAAGATAGNGGATGGATAGRGGTTGGARGGATGGRGTTGGAGGGTTGGGGAAGGAGRGGATGGAGRGGTTGGGGAAGGAGSGGTTGGAGSGGATGGGGAAGGAAGTSGATGVRCQGLAPTCGPMGNATCCASALVPGGTFNRSNDASAPATVSDFRLDVYEVTVGRYRSFMQALPGSLPAAGSGRNPRDASDQGWDPTWNALIETNLDTRRNRFRVCNGHSWTDTPGAGEALPINCVSWYEAAAFCVFDGGRLPTEAEWNYAAAGGAEQRVYPWSVPPTSATIDRNHLVCGSAVAAVGSKSPDGDGRWGHADLAGNVYEWVADYFGTYPLPCVDCALHVTPAAPVWRVDRGGGITVGVDSCSGQFETKTRGNATPETSGYADVGIRCARAP